MSVSGEPTGVVSHVRRQIAEKFEAKVRDWLDTNVDGFAEAHIKSINSSATGGLSGETFIITAELPKALKDSPRTIVLKKDVVDKKTNPQTSFANLVAAQTALGAIAELRVPRVLGFEPSADPLGAPFLVMEFVAGEIPADVPSYAAAGWVHDATVAQRSMLWQSGIDFLVRLHKLDWRVLGLGQLRSETSGTDDLDRSLNYIIAMFRREAAGQTSPIIERAIAWLLANRPALDSECICWGDARIGNMIWRDFECVAAIDWEMSSLGCPGIDLGWWSFFHRWSTFGQGHAQLDGMCVGPALADLYEARGGRPIEHFRYYEILATVRGLSVWLRMYQFMHAEGKLPVMNPLGESIHMLRVLQALMDQADQAG